MRPYFRTLLEMSLGLFLLILSCNSFADMNADILENDISTIPPQYQKDVERALSSWQILKKQEAAFYKVLGYEIHGDNRSFGLNMIDAPLAHFIYPWSLNNQFPFATTHNTPYFTHYVPLSKMADIGQIIGALDVVFVDGLDFEQFQSNKNAIHVHLKKEVGETTLLLSSEGNADWDITWDEGVTIKKIIIPSSFLHFKIKTQTPNIEVVKSKYAIKRFDESYKIDRGKGLNLDRNFYQGYANNINEATGTSARSIWFGKKTSLITVDGSSNAKNAPHPSPLPLNYQKPEYPYHNKDAKAAISVTDGYQAFENKLKVIDDRTSGHWYWEVEYKLTQPSGLRATYQVGAGHYGANFPTKIGSIVINNDVMQFALDLDESYLYVGLNGNWIVGNPNQKGSGVRLAPNLAHSPALYMSADIDDKLEQPSASVNFGATPFIYSSPASYLPYDSRFSEARKNDASKTSAPYKLQKVDFELAEFPTRVYQRTSPQFKIAWQNFQKSIADYRQSACSLTYAYKANTVVSANNLDPQCAWFIKGYFNESMYFPIRELKGSQGKAREKLPGINTKNAKLHFIQTYEAKNQKDDELTPVHLKITDTSAPLIIFIYAHRPLQWNIELAKGVQIRQIIMYGQYSQQYKFNRKINVPVNLYSSEEDTSGVIWPAMHAGKSSVSAMSNELNKLVGLTPATMQSFYGNSEYLIDGHLGVDYLTNYQRKY